MNAHPVCLRIEPPARMERMHVLIRLALLIALGAVGCSSVYWLVYLAMPAVAALVVSQKGSRYLTEDGPGIVRALRWLAAAYAYLWLLTDCFPRGEPRGPIDLQVEIGGTPTTGSALLRLVTSLPALVVLAALSLAALLLWPIGAIALLVSGRVPSAIVDFVTLKLTYQFRIIAYHLSLVERYPSLEASAPGLPHSDPA